MTTAYTKLAVNFLQNHRSDKDSGQNNCGLFSNSVITVESKCCKKKWHTIVCPITMVQSNARIIQLIIVTNNYWQFNIEFASANIWSQLDETKFSKPKLTVYSLLSLTCLVSRSFQGDVRTGHVGTPHQQDSFSVRVVPTCVFFFR